MNEFVEECEECKRERINIERKGVASALAMRVLVCVSWYGRV